MIKLYELREWSNKIEEVEFERVTEHFGFKSNGRRERLNTYSKMFTSLELAQKAKLDRLVDRREFARREFDSADRKLAEFKKELGLI